MDDDFTREFTLSQMFDDPSSINIFNDTRPLTRVHKVVITMDRDACIAEVWHSPEDAVNPVVSSLKSPGPEYFEHQDIWTKITKFYVHKAFIMGKR